MLTPTCLGGASIVTGSKHMLPHGGTRIVSASGMATGGRELGWSVSVPLQIRCIR